MKSETRAGHEWWWERGYRCHGAWCRAGGAPGVPVRHQRLGYVGLSPPGTSPVIYSWGLDDVPEARGTCTALRAAKRRVRAAIKQHYSWMYWKP